MKFINISRAQKYQSSIHSFSSESDAAHSAGNLLKEGGFWQTSEGFDGRPEYVVIDLKDSPVIDSIEIAPVPSEEKSFPRDFRIEASTDGSLWHVLKSESAYRCSGSPYILPLPPVQYRFYKLYVTGLNAREDGKAVCKIASFSGGISGVAAVTADSASAETSAENLFRGAHDLVWRSPSRGKSGLETLLIDLGAVYHVNRIIIGASSGLFPEKFNVDISTDGELFLPLFEEKSFKAEPMKRYSWNMEICPVRYIRFEGRGAKDTAGGFSIELASLEIFAALFDYSHAHNASGMPQYASTFQAGIVKLAADGGDSPGTAVQGSDRRLCDATTIFKGIVQLAEDGDNSAGIAVQGSDSRLKPATEEKNGIVRLAYDRETQPGTAVQGSDSRLSEATDSTFGIVKLCPDGLYTGSAVITGNDSRIQKATDSSFGIVKLAKNGENTIGCVVQADDRRLRDASTAFKGIVELAEDGESSEGVAIQGNDRRLKDATTGSRGIVELAEDGEDAAGVVVQGNDRRLKDATTGSRGIVELAEDGEDAAGVVVQGNDRRLKDATTGSRGIVELAEDGEDAAGVVVQGNDRRLKDASETFKGIMQFAPDGTEKPLTAVQASDKRLRPSTTLSPGIVELAEDGEDAAGVVVQGNDRRLRDATTGSRGIVELAEDGEDRPGVVVQGNDKRLKDATEDSAGIMRFASDGDSSPFAAVQGSDKRLRKASTLSPGIVELAEDGEDAAGVVVQGNDRRLKEATTISRGIVELGEDGEEKKGVAVQGSDRRLKPATEKTPGIVRLAQQGENKEGTAVQGNDPRLYDRREPLEHTHDYAPLLHEFKSHSGTISIKQERNEAFPDITPPSDGSAVIYGQNASKEAGSIGVAGVAGILSTKTVQSYGVVGHGGFVGVRGQSAGGENGVSGCGVLGLSRFGAGGVFSSEHGFSLVADGFGRLSDYDKSVNLAGNGDALLVNGRSVFDGQVKITGDGKGQYPASIVEMFVVEETEYISPGDLLVVSDSGKSALKRSSAPYSQSVVGIVAGNPMLVINNSGDEQKAYPVALAGRVMCKVDARKGPVNPGDLIVTSDTPGCGIRGKIDSFDKIGTVIGKALDRIDEGIGLIPVFITHL